jgi:TPR repeat protein
MACCLAGLLLLVGLAAPASAGMEEGVAAYQRGDYATAIREFKPLAGKGDAKAQFHLGEIHGQGRGVKRDLEEAARWYRQAAMQGHGEAQAVLGGLYAADLGVPRDFGRAYYWLIIAALWDSGEIREEAFRSLGAVAKYLSAKEKAEAVRRARKEWLKQRR